jgi:hypothetical protein
MAVLPWNGKKITVAKSLATSASGVLIIYFEGIVLLTAVKAV